MNNSSPCQQLRHQLERLRNIQSHVPESKWDDAELSNNLQDILDLQQQIRDECDQPIPEPTPLDPPLTPPDSRGPTALPGYPVPTSPPYAVAYASSAATPEILLADVTDQGISTSLWNDQTPASSGGEWDLWTDHPNSLAVPTDQWLPTLSEESGVSIPPFPMVGWVDPATNCSRFNGFFGTFDSGSGNTLGTPWWELPNGIGQPFTIASLVPPVSPEFGAGFDPATAASWDLNGIGRLNVFGTVGDLNAGGNSRLSLRELYWDGQDWNWNDHESPDEDVVSLDMSSQSLLFANTEQRGFLFATARSRNPDDVSVQLYWWNPNDNPQWSWHDLGKPDGTGGAMRAPLALSYHETIEKAPYTTRLAVSVFVVAFTQNEDEDREEGLDGPSYPRWRLYERKWQGAETDDINDWTEWIHHGRPLEVSINRGGGGSDEMNFNITCGVVWADSNQATRINLFGYTKPFDDTAGIRSTGGGKLRHGGQLVERWLWNGDWHWGSNSIVEAFCPERQENPELLDVPVPLVVSSAVVVETQSRDHISVFGFSETNTIWERFFDSRTTPSWTFVMH